MSVIAQQPQLLAPTAAPGRRASGPVDAVAQQLQALVGSMDSMFARVSAMQRRASAQYFPGGDTSASNWDLEVEESELVKCTLAPVKQQIATKIVAEVIAATPELLRKTKVVHAINSPSILSPEPGSTRDSTPTKELLLGQTTGQAEVDNPDEKITQTVTAVQQSAKTWQPKQQPSTAWVVEAVAEPMHMRHETIKEHKTSVQTSPRASENTTQSTIQPRTTTQAPRPKSPQQQQQQQQQSGLVIEAMPEPTSVHQLSASTKLAKAYPVTDLGAALEGSSKKTNTKPYPVRDLASASLAADKAATPPCPLKAASTGDFGHQLQHHQTFRPQPLEHSQSVYQLHHSQNSAQKGTKNTPSSSREQQNVVASASEGSVAATNKFSKLARATSAAAKPGIRSVLKRTVSFPSQTVHGDTVVVDENFLMSALDVPSMEQLSAEQHPHHKPKKNSMAKKVLRYLGHKLSRKNSKAETPAVATAQKSHTAHPSSLDATQRTISDETYMTVDTYTTVPEEEEEEREVKVQESVQVAPQSPHLLTRAATAPNPETSVEEEEAVVPAQPVEKEPAMPKFSSADFEPLVDLATGSFGKATLCRYAKTGAPCVLKAVLKGDVLRRNQQRQLLWERWSMATLSLSDCPFVVRIYGAFLEPRVVNFVLEYVAGGELFSYMREKRRLCESQAKFYAAQVLLALEHMQKEHSIVYRDLKPENLLINYDGYLKMVDFGFAKQLRRTDRTYTQCGTTDYLAPEIILSKGHGYEVDMWSFGVLLFEMLCGDVPFKGENPYSLYSNIIHGTFTMPDFLSPAAKSIISGLLTVDRTCRLGCSKHGISELRLHPFFQDVDFPAICKKKLLAPYLPPVMHAFDMQNFRDTATALPQQQPEDTAALPDKYYQMCAIIDQREFPDFDCWLSEPTI